MWLLLLRARRRANAHRRKAASRDPFTYCDLPKTTRKGIIWNEFELVIRDPTKGIGLVAKKDLPKNLCIPYGGKYLTPREWKHLYKHCNDGGFHRISHTAEVDCLRDDGEVELGALDAHPTRMQQEQVPAGAWPGAYCNQGITRTELNGKLLQHDERCTAPAYQWMDNQCRPLFVQLTRPVLTGEEILVDYGYSADRQTRWGFGPKANLSTVKSEYAFRPQTKVGKYGETQIVG